MLTRQLAVSAARVNTSASLDDKGLNPPSYTPQTNLMSKIIFRPQIIKKAIRKLKSDSAAGLDDIPPILIKKCVPELAPSLSKLFQLSYESGIFPESWKIARVTPIPKKGTHLKSPITDLSRSPLFSPK